MNRNTARGVCLFLALALIVGPAMGAQSVQAEGTTVPVVDVYQITLGDPSGTQIGNPLRNGSAGPYLAAQAAAIAGTLASRTTYTPAEASVWGAGDYGGELYMISVVRNIPFFERLKVTKVVDYIDQTHPAWTNVENYTYYYLMNSYSHVPSTQADGYLTQWTCSGGTCTFTTGTALAENYTPAGTAGNPPSAISNTYGLQVRQTLSVEVVSMPNNMTGCSPSPRGYTQCTTYVSGASTNLGTFVNTSSVPPPTPNLAAVTTKPLFCIGKTTTVDLNLADVANLYGYQFTVRYDQTKASAVGAFVDDYFTTAVPAFKPLGPPPWNADCTATPGTCRFSVTHTSPQVAVSGSGTLARITFTGVAPGAFDVTIANDELSDIDGALLTHTLGGPLPMTVCGLATVSGFVTMQGRPGDIVNAGTVTLSEQAPTHFSPVASVPFNPANGAYSIEVPYWPGGSSYKIEAAHGLYLTNSKMFPTVSGNLANVNTRLWGGDATNDGKVKIADLGCIGGAFGQSPVTTICGGPTPAPTGSPDINADNKVNVQDLSIAGGNFDKCGEQPWDWVGGIPVTTCP
jgi:hypothetical protein